MHIKICGITNTEDALQAVQAGASHIGLIFVENSPRFVTTKRARDIVAALHETSKAGKKTTAVGVFQNHSHEQIAEIVIETGIDIIQLHGSEDPAFCRSIGLRLGKPVIKTVIVDSGEGGLPDSEVEKQAAAHLPSLAKALDSYCNTSENNRVDYLLFDRAKGNPGAGWLASAVTQIGALEKDKPLPPYFFAGGLTPDNLASVLNKIKPAGIDVASGVEAGPGKKDPVKVEAFIFTARKAIAQEAYEASPRSKK
jgi:phosphoribosylanthranilate isomerase